VAQNKRREGPRPQGFQSAGPGNTHGAPVPDLPARGDLDARPFFEEGGRSAQDPDAMARCVRDQGRQGSTAEGNAGPPGAQKDRQR
jgi:hypothetical protein